ncbi:MAG: pyrimidine-nucleoside phosphorylase [Bacilli bacterium]|nr:pyrimidine-nucleoside phosphorylase [Bacilli bacterium]
MRMVDLILKKRDNLPLTEEEIKFIIKGYTEDKIPDYQIASLLMAICFRGMTDAECFYLTKAMVESGEVLDLSGIKGKTVDKHSTGGVGYKTSLALGPLVASCGVKLAKMSGRGLGHTGGTLDKLESIPGFHIELSEEEFIDQVNDIGMAIIGQTKDMCPADKKLYALRDVTGTVESIPLIASSIMSKKIAAGAKTIVLDVKVGSGAFMKDLDSARTLSKTMVEIGKQFGRNVSAVITNMDEPLGEAVGNSLEVVEAIETLKGRGPEDFTELVLNLGAHILYNAQEVTSLEEGIKILQENIKNGKALTKFRDFVQRQGGNPDVTEDYSLLPQAKYTYEVKANITGYIKAIDALAVGNYAMKLGAGRLTKESPIDLAVGLKIKQKIGAYVNENTLLGEIYSNQPLTEEHLAEFRKLFTITTEKVEKPQLILDLVR